MGSYAEEESLVLWKRNSPADFAVKMIERLPLNYHQGVLNAGATANNGGIPTEEEWTAYARSMWKKAYMLWTCLDPRHKQDPKTNRPLHLFDGVQWAMKILYAATQHDAVADEAPSKIGELMAKCHIVSQEAVIKNFSGRLDQQVETAATDSKNESATTDGQQSSTSSPQEES